ncbi:Myc-type, basic helix-loop-helix (bHLH) domain [Dillenia turbinata]|uniref:Myc-type, basic helix-loop-helix (BHLH) domain n=1 Tax=Dillenia turbinata TaxID=194707 RepID=A0AAN8UV08_9MAGN
MESFCWSSESYTNVLQRMSIGFSENYGSGMITRGGVSSSSSFVLDYERGELVKSPGRVGAKNVSAEKATIALRNHSEAERRRRGRINAHLSTLRELVPSSTKMDKASLLAEVVSYLKELKTSAEEASKAFLIPMDTDEVKVVHQKNEMDEAHYSLRASLCCEYSPEILSGIRKALDALCLRIVKAEIATLGSRMKNIVVMTGSREENSEDDSSSQLRANSVQEALQSVLSSVSPSQELSSQGTNKRRRVSYFNFSSSSSLEDTW